MPQLDDVASMKKLDPSGVLESTSLFPNQCEQAWNESSSLKFPAAYKQVKNIVVCGMGGSRFTPKTIKELFRGVIKVPYEIVEDYTLPGYVGSDTLVVLSSFSGTTEETIACGEEAYAKGAYVTAVCQGGKIRQLVESHQGIGYFFDPKHNPCGQPRIGGGYLLFGHLGLLSSLGLVEVDPTEIKNAIDHARSIGAKYVASIPESTNGAKQLARTLQDKHVFVITAEFLKGFGNGFANQINETAKMISDYRYIPELNHHLMEGLKRPETLKQNGLFMFLESDLYTQRVKKRFTITKNVVEKQQVKTLSVKLTGTTFLAQALEAFTLSGFTTFYMAMLYETDPVAIPWVDYFKAELQKN